MKNATLLVVTLGAMVIHSLAYANDPMSIAESSIDDTDTQTYFVDSDGDTFPDVTEEIGGTDPLDPTGTTVKSFHRALIACICLSWTSKIEPARTPRQTTMGREATNEKS